jgi:hypothetical protein
VRRRSGYGRAGPDGVTNAHEPRFEDLRVHAETGLTLDASASVGQFAEDVAVAAAGVGVGGREGATRRRAANKERCLPDVQTPIAARLLL